MLLFYLLVLTFIILVAIGGFDATMRLIAYTDLQFRYSIIKVRSYFMMRKVRGRLIKDREKLLKELTKDD